MRGAARRQARGEGIGLDAAADDPQHARLSCGTIRCQINGTYVPVAEFELAAGDWIYFSPKVLLWTDPATTLTIPRP